ncbi:hypothetical protein J0S82_013358, partial [Galemys pyrenaicus]
ETWTCSHLKPSVQQGQQQFFLSGLPHSSGVLHCEMHYSQLLQELPKEYRASVLPAYPPKKLFSLISYRGAVREIYLGLPDDLIVSFYIDLNPLYAQTISHIACGWITGHQAAAPATEISASKGLQITVNSASSSTCLASNSEKAACLWCWQVTSSVPLPNGGTSNLDQAGRGVPGTGFEIPHEQGPTTAIMVSICLLSIVDDLRVKNLEM